MKTVSIKRFRRAAVIMVTVAVVLLPSVFGTSAQAAVVFWNKLGSDAQVAQSEVGPPLVRQGSVNYEPGRFGNGVRVDSAFPGYFLLNESLMNALILQGRGTIALWVKTSWPSTDASGGHMFFDTDLNDSDDRMAMGHWFDNTITIGFFPVCHLSWQINLPGTYSDHGIHFQAGEWHHWAMVWDNAGIDGTGDLFRFYFDGALALVGEAGCPVRASLPPPRLHYFGRHVWDSVHADAVLDNLVFYDFAKTDFSDRFNEDPEAPLDQDGDGIPDSEDDCPNSDLSATVVMDGCDSGVPNTVFPSGCIFSDLIAACAEDATNHGQFVSCVSHLTNDLKKAGTITGQQKGAIQSCAAKAHIP